MNSSGPASPRARACRPSRSSTRRRCSASASPIISARRSGGRSRWRSSVESVACTLVSGVRSSCPASAAKRRVAARARVRSAAERPRRASIALKLAASERSSVGPPGGTRRSRSSSSATLEATVRSRRSGRSTRSAASHTPALAAARASSPSAEQPAVERGLAVLQRGQRGHDLQARETAEALVVQRGDVGAIALAVRGEGLQPALQARVRGRRRAGVEQDRSAEREAQRRGGGREDRIEALVVLGELVVDGRQRRRPRQLRRCARGGRRAPSARRSRRSARRRPPPPAGPRRRRARRRA